MVDLYLAFTLLAATAAGLCGLHARATGRRSLFLALVVYGLALEKLVVVGFEAYSYPAARFLDLAGIPLAIGFGWAAILYAGVETARDLGVDGPWRAAVVAPYALHVDLAMDAVAIQVPYWTWAGPGDWFGVPLGNFFGWFAVAALFVGVHGALEDRLGEPGPSLAALAGAPLLLYASLELWNLVTAGVRWRELAVLGGLTAVALAVAARQVDRPGRGTAGLAGPLAVAPAVAVGLFHLYYLGLLVVLGLATVLPLVAASLAMLAVSVAVHVPLYRSPGSEAVGVVGD